MTTSTGPSGPTVRQPAPLRDPSDLIVGGIALIVGGWFVGWFLVMAFDSAVPLLLGWAASLIGGLLVLIGAVAAGVRLGMQWAERDRTS